MRTTVTSVAQSVVLSTQKAKEIAQIIGKPYPTMMRELNPFDASAKLGVKTLVDIMRIVQDMSPLAYMAEELGYSVEPKSE